MHRTLARMAPIWPAVGAVNRAQEKYIASSLCVPELCMSEHKPLMSRAALCAQGYKPSQEASSALIKIHIGADLQELAEVCGVEVSGLPG